MVKTIFVKVVYLADKPKNLGLDDDLIETKPDFSTPSKDRVQW